jgi:hypothetical protein
LRADGESTSREISEFHVMDRATDVESVHGVVEPAVVDVMMASDSPAEQEHGDEPGREQKPTSTPLGTSIATHAKRSMQPSTIARRELEPERSSSAAHAEGRRRPASPAGEQAGEAHSPTTAHSPTESAWTTGPSHPSSSVRPENPKAATSAEPAARQGSPSTAERVHRAPETPSPRPQRDRREPSPPRPASSMVHIGHVEVFIAAPPTNEPARAAEPTPWIDGASRRYLRRP